MVTTLRELKENLERFPAHYLDSPIEIWIDYGDSEKCIILGEDFECKSMNGDIVVVFKTGKNTPEIKGEE